MPGEKIGEGVFQFLAIFGGFIHILWLAFATIYAVFTNDIDMMGYCIAYYLLPVRIFIFL